MYFIKFQVVENNNALLHQKNPFVIYIDKVAKQG
jgi:hypothetical protein